MQKISKPLKALPPKINASWKADSLVQRTFTINSFDYKSLSTFYGGGGEKERERDENTGNLLDVIFA